MDIRPGANTSTSLTQFVRTNGQNEELVKMMKAKGEEIFEKAPDIIFNRDGYDREEITQVYKDMKDLQKAVRLCGQQVQDGRRNYIKEKGAEKVDYGTGNVDVAYDRMTGISKFVQDMTTLIAAFSCLALTSSPTTNAALLSNTPLVEMESSQSSYGRSSSESTSGVIFKNRSTGSASSSSHAEMAYSEKPGDLIVAEMSSDLDGRLQLMNMVGEMNKKHEGFEIPHIFIPAKDNPAERVDRDLFYPIPSDLKPWTGR
jgi:hypothetical protein